MTMADGSSQKSMAMVSGGDEPSQKKIKLNGDGGEIEESLTMGVFSSFDWRKILTQAGVDTAPVSAFKFAPMNESWDNFTIGMKVEIPNMLCDVVGAYWIATVIRIAGYKSLMRYEGYEEDGSRDFWVNLCCKAVHPVGWCATVKKPLVPPKDIQQKESDWKEYLVKKLTGSKTLPAEFHTKVMERVWDCPIKEGMKVEVVNKYLISTMRPATVSKVYGRRLAMKYDPIQKQSNLASSDIDFFCHQSSPVIHPVGWSSVVGHKISSTPEYRSGAELKARSNSFTTTDSRPKMFPDVLSSMSDIVNEFQEGDKLEALDPLNLSHFCPSTVMKVLKNGYIMIGIDGSLAKDGSDWFAYHINSPYLLPVGECQQHGIPLTPPKAVKGKFSWDDYLRQTKSKAVPTELFNRAAPKHGFKPGMKIEGVDLMDPRLICVATITTVIGRLLRIHFDGWDSSFDQWVDCESPDIYPVGWCELVGYRLEGPKIPEPIEAAKTKAKSKSKGGSNKKKRSSTASSSTVAATANSSMNSSKLSLGSSPSQSQSSRAEAADGHEEDSAMEVDHPPVATATADKAAANKKTPAATSSTSKAASSQGDKVIPEASGTTATTSSSSTTSESVATTSTTSSVPPAGPATSSSAPSSPPVTTPATSTATTGNSSSSATTSSQDPSTAGAGTTTASSTAAETSSATTSAQSNDSQGVTTSGEKAKPSATITQEAESSSTTTTTTDVAASSSSDKQAPPPPSSTTTSDCNQNQQLDKKTSEGDNVEEPVAAKIMTPD